MKRLTYILSAMALIFLSMTAAAQSKDSEGHTLVSLWKSYDKARAADKPADAADVLQNIKQEAKARSLAWDFYDAANRYVGVKASINWKDWESLQKAMDKEVESSNMPVMEFYHRNGRWSIAEAEKFIKENEKALKASCNREFHSADSYISGAACSAAVKALLENDYDYALYSIQCRLGSDMARKWFAGRYPLGDLASYQDICRLPSDKRTPAAEAYAKKLAGKAAALPARLYLLEQKLYKYREENVGSDSCKALLALCEVYNKDRASFSGSEKTIAQAAESADELISKLKGSEILAEVKDGEVVMKVRNCSSVKLVITSDGTTIHQATVKNTRCSFFAQDELRYRLPAIDDGDYAILLTGSGEECSLIYEKYTISMAMRVSENGKAAFVADSSTGEPLKTCGFRVFDQENKLKTSCDGLSLKGFTELPSGLLESGTSRNWLRIQAFAKDASGRLRLSHAMYVPGYRNQDTASYDDYTRCKLIMDRRAFNPGETVHFKAVLFKGFYSFKTIGAGQAVEVTLKNQDSKIVSRKSFTTNEFGSVAGDFELVRQEKGGRMTLDVIVDGRTVVSESISVDEFVLPTFTVSWDKDEELHLSGDKIRLSGRVKAYSGHSLTSAVVKARVWIKRSEVLSEQPLKLAADGSFTVEYQTEYNDSDTRYYVEVTVTDGTGETASSSTSVDAIHSIGLDLKALNCSEGKLDMTGSDYGESWILAQDVLKFNAASYGWFHSGVSRRDNLEISYELLSNGKRVASGSAGMGGDVEISMKGMKSGLYILVVKAAAKDAAGRSIEEEKKAAVLKVADSDKSLNADVKCLIRPVAEDNPTVQIGSTDGPVWAVVELFGSGKTVLESLIVHLDGQKGKQGSMTSVTFKRKASWPETVTVKVLWFHEGRNYQYTWNVPVQSSAAPLPLSFTRFLDTTVPGVRYSFAIATAPDTECAATVFDLSTETIAANSWSAVEPSKLPYTNVNYFVVCGGVSGHEEVIVGYNAFQLSGVKVRGASKVMANEASVGVLYDVAPEMASVAEEEEVRVREDFASTVAWEPFLKSDKDGKIEFAFTNADKLSTYAVQLFAHDRDFHNAVLRRTMLVTIPVKIAVVQPQYICIGDRYVIRTTLSSNSAKTIAGKLECRVLDGSDRLKASEIFSGESAVTVPAGGSVANTFEVTVPAGIKDMGLLLSFTPDSAADGSDAVFVSMPVHDGMQTIIEAHSALLKSGMDKDAMIARLRGEFTGVPGSEASVREISILDMLKEAVPERVEARGENAISVTEAIYANCLAARLRSTELPVEVKGLLEKLKACQNSAGGFAWFEGMTSSPIVTALVLERIKAMPEVDFAAAGIRVEPAVEYLDSEYFGSTRPVWCGSLSLEQYLYTRSLFPEVAFSTHGAAADNVSKFKKETKAYLVPSKARGLNGMVLAKARRLLILRNLCSSSEGAALSKAWGIASSARLERSANADAESLKQYAVEHVSGGCYFPNAVMPFRGLLESELYAHTLLCKLFQGTDIAEGIRLWIMVQKETQKWDDDPAYIEAIAAVMEGRGETLETSVVSLSAVYTTEYENVKAAGNGFTVERRWFRDGKELTDGDTLHLGDRIHAEYRIWNQENRSFVLLTAPRPACMRPVEQISGHIGWWLHPLRVSSVYEVTPQGYRSVLADRTEYWFDTYPEENTTVGEDLFVTQEGCFRMPALTIESLYAPHYRANGAGSHAVSVKGN